MSDVAEQEDYIARALAELRRREEGGRFYRMYPDDGPFARDKYVRHIEFFELGSRKQFTALLGGNGVGKSIANAYETTAHLTGDYAPWWPGHRYEYGRGITNWTAGVDFKSIRESLQLTLFGRRGHEGTGMIPREKLIDVRYGQNDVVDFAKVKHVSGGESRCVIKCYEQGREAFQAANVDDIAMDEEPKDATIYSECVQRFRGETALGHVRLTFTPLFGVSDVVCLFLPQFMEQYDEDEYERSSRGYVNCTLDDVPHITPEEKAIKIANLMPHEREARINGTPSIGEGKVYPFAEEGFVIDPIPIPRYWPRIYGLDPGRTVTAAVWLAHDTDTDVVYAYSEHYVRDQLPPVHAVAIKARGVWIPGVIDPSAKSKNPLVDETVLSTYVDSDNRRKLGLRLKLADNEVGEGILAVYQRLATGRLKIFRTLTDTLREFRQYSRDKHQRIRKVNDHAMDALRYGIMGLKHAMLPHGDVNARGIPKQPEETFGVYG